MRLAKSLLVKLCFKISDSFACYMVENPRTVVFQCNKITRNVIKPIAIFMMNSILLRQIHIMFFFPYKHMFRNIIPPSVCLGMIRHQYHFVFSSRMWLAYNIIPIFQWFTKPCPPIPCGKLLITILTILRLKFFRTTTVRTGVFNVAITPWTMPLPPMLCYPSFPFVSTFYAFHDYIIALYASNVYSSQNIS